MKEMADGTKVYVIGTGGGAKRVAPPVQLAKAGSVLQFKNLARFSQIVKVDFRDKREFFSYDASTQTVAVAPETPPDYYEYDLTVRTSVNNPIEEGTHIVEETAEGNSRPGVIVEA